MEERLSIKEAAERLGVSADTVRRRLKKGELAGEKEPTPQGGEWRILLPVERDEPTPTPLERAAETVGGVVGDVVEIAQLRERVAGLERLTDELQGERDAWRDQAARAEDAARELRILLRQAQALAIPANTEGVETHAIVGQGENDPALHTSGLLGIIARIRARLGVA